MGGAIAVNSVRREYPDPMAPELLFCGVSSGGAACDSCQCAQMLEAARIYDIMDVSGQPIKSVKR